jgi:hypothetical protein
MLAFVTRAQREAEVVSSGWRLVHQQSKRKNTAMKKQQVNTVSLAYKRLPVEAVPPCAAWVVTCMSGNAAFAKPPIPYVPPVPRLSQKFFYVMGGAKAKVNPVGRTRLRTAAKANSFCHHRAS